MTARSSASVHVPRDIVIREVEYGLVLYLLYPVVGVVDRTEVYTSQCTPLLAGCVLLCSRYSIGLLVSAVWYSCGYCDTLPMYTRDAEEMV